MTNNKTMSLFNEIDVTAISVYTKKIADLGDGFNKMMGGVYLRDFIIAYDLSVVMLAKATQVEIQAKYDLEEKEAIAFLDKAPDYFKERGEKPTVESKKAFVALDLDVRAAQEIVAQSTAMVVLLKGKVSEFKDAIYSVKTIVNDNNNTSNYMY
jgi:hypothetical protein